MNNKLDLGDWIYLIMCAFVFTVMVYCLGPWHDTYRYEYLTEQCYEECVQIGGQDCE